MGTKNEVVKAISATFDALIALLPSTKVPRAKEIVAEFEAKYPLKSRADGRTTAWDDKRRAEASKRWEEKRNSEVFYFYKPDKDKVKETVVQGIEAACVRLGVREAYLRSGLSAGRGIASFGTGARKTTVSRERFSSDPEQRFIQEFRVRFGREPGHHEFPSPGVY